MCQLNSSTANYKVSTKNTTQLDNTHTNNTKNKNSSNNNNNHNTQVQFSFHDSWT